MERITSSSIYRNIYSYQTSINNNENTESNRFNTNIINNINTNNNVNNSYMVSNQALSEYNLRRLSSNDNNNLIEILQNATDDSNNEEGSNDNYNDNNNNNNNNNNEVSTNRDMDYNLFKDQSVLSGDNSFNLTNEDLLDTNYYFKNHGRALTAPTKLNNEAEEFKYSTKFICLEKAVRSSNNLIIRSDGKFDVDSEDAVDVFKYFLNRLEDLIKVILKFNYI